MKPYADIYDIIIIHLTIASSRDICYDTVVKQIIKLN